MKRLFEFVNFINDHNITKGRPLIDMDLAYEFKTNGGCKEKGCYTCSHLWSEDDTEPCNSCNDNGSNYNLKS